jgi:alkylation response protein AidB-like acyl-CoA dehydrogenase
MPSPVFTQAPPQPRNRFRSDRALRRSLERLLPTEVFATASVDLDRMGERAATEMPALADAAERDPPRHIPYDAWGRRIDRIEVSPAWLKLVEIGQAEGLVAIAYEAPYAGWSRVVQAGLANLYDPVSAMATCPLVMTDGAARLLKRHAPDLAAACVPRLTARENAWTSGQWMTETTGGSDVSGVSTLARPTEDGRFTLHGVKWFTSATTADMALVLARTKGAEAGSRGLSLFHMALRNPDNGWNGLQVRRLKDKLGTHALPTSEIELDGAIATPVGGLGRGVAKLGDLLNIARLWSAWSGPAGTGHLLDLARDYAGRRVAFGAPLSDNPIHRGWLARIAAEYEAMLSLSFETAAALGREEHGANAGLARLLAPLTKLACARQGIWAVSELVESFGGAGYLEDTGIPRILRNVHVNCAWEGTTSVLAHDVLRVLGGSDLGGAWLEDVERRLADVTLDRAAGVVARTKAAVDQLKPLIAAPDPAAARRIAWGMAKTYQAALLAEAAQWSAARGDVAALAATELFTREPLVSADVVDVDLRALALG